MNNARLSLILTALLVGLPDVFAEVGQNRGPLGTVEIGATLLALADSSDSVEVEHGIAFDIYTEVPTRNGAWSVLVEATAHPMSGQDSWKPSQDDEGRLAEFHYNLRALGGDWWIGLLDSKAYIDGSVVANDDKEQFLGAPFTNNPSIAIPENSLGFAYRRDQGPIAPGYTVLTITHDTEAAETNSRSAGLFLAAEVFREMDGTIARLGAWADSSSHPAVTDYDPVGEQHGLYASLDGQLAGLGWNVRAGTARFGASARASFVSVAAQIPWKQNVLGIAAGHSAHDGSGPTGIAGRSNHLEIYYRFTALGRFVITPDIQYRQFRGHGGSKGSFSACVRLRIVM